MHSEPRPRFPILSTCTSMWTLPTQSGLSLSMEMRTTFSVAIENSTFGKTLGMLECDNGTNDSAMGRLGIGVPVMGGMFLIGFVVKKRDKRVVFQSC